MTIIEEFLLMPLISYLINLASGERSAAIASTREAEIKETLEKDETLRKALASTRSIRDEIRGACTELARNRKRLGLSAREEELWRLLSDQVFQADLTEWLMAGAIEEGNAVKNRILQAMETALATAGVQADQITAITTGYFESVEKALFAHPVLARWRHQLSLDYLREQVAVLRQRADESVGVYAPEKQKIVLDRYCEKALAAWDIIDLSNLPEGDVQITTQQLLLRQLYMPLRIEVESAKSGDDDDAVLARLEKGRDARRHREAGHQIDERGIEESERKPRVPIGERLKTSRRIVALGDPGGGKTTMLRWIATAYLLRYKGDPAFNRVPDTGTLPNNPWIPVFIRCRDLGDVDLCRCFTDFLTQHLNKTDLLPNESEIMRAVILDRIAKGEALILVDGLDEITNPRVRIQFCQELERTAVRYPHAPIVVTSRIVGYRDMPYRMGSGFEHGVIAELNQSDKDLFATRWVEVTEQHQPASEKAKRVQELIEALHSSDRIERLTGNPMLLTTLALVKRKVGKLPNRRTKLYAEAVSVLLNWNPRLYQTIEEDEAIPQLEYLAYEMCRRGVQRLMDEEVFELLDNLRVEYPKIRAIRSREPLEFLRHLEQRSSILIRSGGAWEKNSPMEKRVWEFRHLTFQEYLAARAIIDGRYPSRGKPKSLAEQVAPLARTFGIQKEEPEDDEEEEDIPESWREALRLLVADCKDDDVDDVLLAILNPMEDEDAAKARRPRAVLAALCLADEPNVSEENAQKICVALATNIDENDGNGYTKTSLDKAAIEVGSSIWAPLLKRALVTKFFDSTWETWTKAGGLYGMVGYYSWKRSGTYSLGFFTEIVERLNSPDGIEAVSAALIVMQAAYMKEVAMPPGLVEGLFQMLDRGSAERTAGVWALVWLNGGFLYDTEYPRLWRPSAPDFYRLSEYIEKYNNNMQFVRFASVVLSNINPSQGDVTASMLGEKLTSNSEIVRAAVIDPLARIGDKRAVGPLLSRLNDEDPNVRRKAALSLGNLGEKEAVGPLILTLDDKEKNVGRAAVGALAKLKDRQAVDPLLSKLDDINANFRRDVVKALGSFGDRRAVAPLIARLNDPDRRVRLAAIAALQQLGDETAVARLLVKLNESDRKIRRAIIVALGQLGGKEAVVALMDMLNLRDLEFAVPAAVALVALGEASGKVALTHFLGSDDVETRRSAVGAYAEQFSKQMLLSLDLDGTAPWLDSKELITEGRVSDAATSLRVSVQEVRSSYETLLTDLKLKLEWRPHAGEAGE